MFSVLILQEMEAKLGRSNTGDAVAYLLWVPVVYTICFASVPNSSGENPKHQSLAQASAGVPPVEVQDPQADLDTLPVS